MRYLLVISVSLVFGLGFLMVFNTSSADILDRSLDVSTHQAVMKHVLYAVLGCLVGMGLWALGYENFLKLSFPLLCVCTFLLLLTFVPGIGQVRNGARRWIGVAGYTLQPSEFAKYLIPAYFIYYSLKSSEAILSWKAFAKVTAIIGVPLLLIFCEPDNATTAIIGATVVCLCFLTRVKAKYWLLPLTVMVLAGGVAAVKMPYVADRIQVYLDPELDLRGKGHQPHQARIATGSGQVFGKGPGGSIQKLNYLPEAQNDYIAAIYAEEFGFVGVMVLVALYMLITYTGTHIASKARDRGGCYLAAVITFLIALQAFLNLGVVSGLLPSTGLNLPFFSQGGSSLVANLAAVALLLTISKESECRA